MPQGVLPERLAKRPLPRPNAMRANPHAFRALGLLRKAGALGTAILLLEGPLRLVDLQARLGVSLNTARYHLRGLERVGLVHQEPVSDRGVAFALSDPAGVARLIEELYPGWHARAALRKRVWHLVQEAFDRRRQARGLARPIPVK